MGPQTQSRLRFFPVLTLSAFLLPILLGLAGTWLPAFGYLPAIGAENFDLQSFREVLAYPGLPGALRATLISGIGATLLAGVLALWITVQVYGSGLWRLLSRALSPLLAIPHAAFAIGFAFLVAPSGWLMRLVSPELSGFSSPPDWLIVKDPYGLTLTLALALKETPFLLLMCISGLNQLDVRRTLWIGQSYGYRRFRIWTRLIIPQLYPQLRLPVLAVLAYSLSVVDIALILGPSVPPTLAILVDRWFNDPDVGYRLIGAAGATWLFLLVAAAVVIFLCAEKVVSSVFSHRLTDGSRTSIADTFCWTGSAFTWVLLVVSGLCLVILLLWSWTNTWRFPDALPAGYSGRFWLKGLEQAAEPLLTTATIGAGATLMAIVLTVGCLEYEVRLAQKGRAANIQWIMWVVYLPLLLPQIAFLFGIQTACVLLHIEGTWLSMVGIHLVFVLPYTFLTLAGVYRTYDQRYVQVAMAISGSPWRSFFQVKLPMLLKPVAFAMAAGFAVSVAQYLPTLYVGAGRFVTITTETVSLASGSDRRIVAVYALCQFLLPMLAFCAAIFLPAFIFRDRRAMQN